MLLLLIKLLIAAAVLESLDVPVLPGLSVRIAGGDTAEYTPWIAALSFGDVNKRFQCAGSIITDRHILTAAHCVESAFYNGQLASTYMATVGTNVRDGSGQNYKIIKNYTHPEFTLQYVKNDIAILVTNSSIEFSMMVQPVTVNFNRVNDGVAAIILGWGSQSLRGNTSQELIELEMVTINSTYCFDETRRVGKSLNLIPPFIDSEKEICAYRAPGKGTCKGDSGSPLVCADNEEQIGLTSWGIPCALGAPDMFTRISNYKDWIMSVLADMQYEDKLSWSMRECPKNEYIY
ncbi:chymotrypsin-1-like [Zerene cesonia]|uniref:chymotrypsin-1-like n=1 Tax=Zerene cesonia TaxID=33412 RepID=UPI0018E5A85C|nr:chymotrypsin-1-like [Zerene cesonia]